MEALAEVLVVARIFEHVAVPRAPRQGRQNLAHGASHGDRAPNAQPSPGRGGRKAWRRFPPPLPGLDRFRGDFVPLAGARGSILAPLRGWPKDLGNDNAKLLGISKTTVQYAIRKTVRVNEKTRWRLGWDCAIAKSRLIL